MLPPDETSAGAGGDTDPAATPDRPAPAPTELPADPRDEALLRDRATVEALVAPVAEHFREAVASGEVLGVLVTVIVSPSHARTVPILPSLVDEPDRQFLAVALGAKQLGIAHHAFTRRTTQNLQLAARPAEEP